MPITYTKITPGPLTPESIIESTEQVVKQFAFGSLNEEKQRLLGVIATMNTGMTDLNTKIAEKDDLISLIENLP